jgi:8-oxo-dGTP pyrophosphatase MutT (NUDIX family)
MIMLHPQDPSAWETLQSVYLHRRPWMTMRQDRVRLANGNTIDDYYVWEFPPWVNVLAVTPDRRMVLVRQYRHGIGKVFYELPAGVHDRPGESLLESAKRELLEETGYGGGSWSLWMELSPNPALQNNISYSFLAEGVEMIGTQHLDSTEEISVHPVPFEALDAIALEGGMIQALHIAPVLKYLFRNRNCRNTKTEPTP